jgi:hypothetical protein
MPGRLVHIPLWWVIVGVATCVLTPILSIWISVQINQRGEEQAAKREQAVRAEMTVRYCRLLGAQADVYSEAETEVGKQAYATWVQEYRIQGCQPTR